MTLKIDSVSSYTFYRIWLVSHFNHNPKHFPYVFYGNTIAFYFFYEYHLECDEGNEMNGMK